MGCIYSESVFDGPEYRRHKPCRRLPASACSTKIDRFRPWKRGDTRESLKPITKVWAFGRSPGRASRRLATYAQDAHVAIAHLLRGNSGLHVRWSHDESSIILRTSAIRCRRWIVMRSVAADEPLETSYLAEARPVAILKRKASGPACLSPCTIPCAAILSSLQEAADRILFEHFPESLQDAIRDRFRLATRRDDARLRWRSYQSYWSLSFDNGRPTSGMPYCGLTSGTARSATSTGRSAGDLFGLEAAHSHYGASHDCPDDFTNGLALCVIHHRALDRGVIGARTRGRGCIAYWSGAE